MNSSTLSPRDLAQALGVSESSVRRWVDRGVIPSRRTSGGHRRIDVAQAIQYARESGLQPVRPGDLGLELPVSEGRPEDLRQALFEGDDPRARGLVTAAYMNGAGVPELCDRWIQPAMESIGELWDEEENTGVLVEHRATNMCAGLLHRLQGLVPEPTSRPALGAALPEDPYRLPSLMAATVLRAESFAATDLGPDTPLEVLLEAVTDARPLLVWVTANAVPDPEARSAELEAFLDSAPPGIPIVLGGRQLSTLRVRPRPNVHFAASMSELRALAVGVKCSAPKASSPSPEVPR